MQLFRQISARCPKGQRPFNAATCILGLGTRRLRCSLLWDKPSHNGSVRARRFLGLWAKACRLLHPAARVRVSTVAQKSALFTGGQPARSGRGLSEPDKSLQRQALELAWRVAEPAQSKRLESRACKNCPG